MIDWLIERASTFAGDIDWLIFVIAVLVGFWFIVVQAVFFGLIFRYRHREGVKADYLDGSERGPKRLLSTAHALILVCDIIVIVFAIRVWVDVKQTLPEAQQTIRIIGQQWAWTFVQPGPDGQLDTEDDIVTVDELHVKNDTVYHFKLESKDVLHSFSVPVFRLKQDAVPGREITGWFQPNRTGTFDIQCAEMCGLGHGIMGARIHIESAAEHDAWMARFKKA